MTIDQSPNGFTKMEGTNIMSLEKKEMEKSNKKSIQYFIVAKLKSVNEQPQEYLEFKKHQIFKYSLLTSTLIQGYDAKFLANFE